MYLIYFICTCRSRVDFRKLKRNTVIVAEALARYMYKLSDKVRENVDANFFPFKY